jgi:hypothetical protein
MMQILLRSLDLVVVVLEVAERRLAVTTLTLAAVVAYQVVLQRVAMVAPVVTHNLITLPMQEQQDLLLMA